MRFENIALCEDSYGCVYKCNVGPHMEDLRCASGECIRGVLMAKFGSHHCKALRSTPPLAHAIDHADAFRA